MREGEAKNEKNRKMTKKYLGDKLYVKTLSYLLAVLVFLTGCSQGGSLSTTTTSSSTYASSLSSVLQKTYKEYDLSGALLAIKFKDGSIFIDSIGYADRLKKLPLKTTQQFRIGSTTKTITATAILLLYEQGFLSLDDSVISLLPEFKNSLDSDITVRMLLNHTSGIEDYIGCPYKDTLLFYFLAENPKLQWEPKELVDIGIACDDGDLSKNSFLYSNTNYILLGMIIESISKKSYEEYTENNIFSTLNLKKTSFPTTNGFSNEFARGYYERYKDGVLYDYTIQSPSSTWAAGGAISTPLELLAWAEVFGEGHLLDKTTQKEQLEYVDMGEGAKYGLGMLIQDDGTIGHNGTVFGYQTQMFYKDGISIVIYTNSYYQSKDNPTFTTYKDVASIIF